MTLESEPESVVLMLDPPEVPTNSALKVILPVIVPVLLWPPDRVRLNVF